uniref:CCR4-Not complex component Not1 C-terminal domain-containing protein n=1 Tax=Pseudictyota dubia TaxID=2749911 RepID=A0A7R9Z6V1_9STRA
MEQCVAICATDNLELGCMLIEKAATEKAVRDVDEALSPALNARKKHRDQTGQPFYDMSIFTSSGQRYPSALPEPLRPKPGGLRSDQLLVYEAFQRMPQQRAALASQQGSAAGTVAGSGSSSTGSAPAAADGTVAKESGTASTTAQQKINVEALTAVAGKIDSAVTTLLTAAGPRAAEVTLSMLPPDHEVRQLLTAAQRVTVTVSEGGSARTLNNSEKDAILGFSQGIFKRLYELSLNEPLRLEANVAILEVMNECCPQLGQDLGTWATYAPTETEVQRKLHRAILLLLLRSNLVPASEMDTYLARSTENGKSGVWVEFCVVFVRAAVLEKITTLSDLPRVMEVLTNISEGRGQNAQQTVQNYRKTILRLLEELQTPPASSDVPSQVASTVAANSNAASTASTSTSPNSTGATVTPADTSAVTVTTTEDRPSSPVHVQDEKLTHQESSSISAASLNNLAEATKRAAEATELTARNDPPNMKQQVTFLLDNWMRIHNEASGNEKALQFMQVLQQNGVGKIEEQTERFFRLSTELVVEAVLKSAGATGGDMKDQGTQGKALNYTVIDAYAKLISLLIRHMNGGGSTEQVANQRVSLLNKVLGITVRTMLSDYERAKNESGGVVSNWDQRPWFRLFLNLVLDLNSPSPALDPISYGILSTFGSAFHVIQPLVVPGFSFAWLELISHRMFLSNLLLVKGQKGWGLAHQLLIDLFLFLEPHLRRVELTEAVKHLYKGTLRVLLVLLHDFPSFLAGYHLSFCNVIPENCVQLRNLILSAFPKGLVLPDPFTPNLKIDLLPEIARSPTILSNVSGPLGAMRADLDGFLKNRQPSDFVSGLLPRLYKEGNKEVDAPRVNSLVLYVGVQAIARLQNTQIAHTLAHTPEMEVLQKLMEFDDSGRYISLNAIANQLRYPSSHTHYYSCVMLFLFSEAKDEGVKEQVTRVLLERLIVHRPHPWGLLITFIELIKNQRYQFWSHPFTRCATEIEKVFESVARSCMSPASSQRSATAGGGDL